MNLSELKRKKMAELIHMGSELNIEGVSGMRDLRPWVERSLAYVKTLPPK